MPITVKFRRGSTTQSNSFLGEEGELYIDKDKDTVVVHDGVTIGGFPLASEAYLAQAIANFGTSSFSGSYNDLTNKPNLVKAAVPWSANHTLADGTRYLAGDVVYDNGNIYVANYDNESLPTSSALYWTDLGSGNRLNIDGRDIPNISYTQLTNTPTIPSLIGYATETYVDDQVFIKAPKTNPTFNGGSATFDQTAIKMSSLWQIQWGLDQSNTFIGGVGGASSPEPEKIYFDVAGYRALTLSSTGATFSGIVNGITKSMVGLGNVTNESKATMFSSPTFTGAPLTVTATAGTNTTQIATTEFVQTAVSNLVESAPTTLNTLNELAAALGDDPNFATTISNQIGLKANISSLSTVATSGSYNDLLNKPTLSTVANSGSYNDLLNKPSIQPLNGNLNTLSTNGFGVNANQVPQYDANGWLSIGSTWKVKEAGGVLYFAHNGTNRMKIDSSGNLTVSGDVTAFGSV